MNVYCFARSCVGFTLHYLTFIEGCMCELSNSARRSHGSHLNMKNICKDPGCHSYAQFYESCVHLGLDNAAGVWGSQEHSIHYKAAHTYEVLNESVRMLLFDISCYLGNDYERLHVFRRGIDAILWHNNLHVWHWCDRGVNLWLVFDSRFTNSRFNPCNPVRLSFFF